MFYLRFLKQNKCICEECGYQVQTNSTKRIELLIDHGTWHPMDEDMITQNVLKFSDEDSYENRIIFYQKKMGLAIVIQMGRGKLKGFLLLLELWISNLWEVVWVL
jgi:acetyl-CoA carboxylase carboxyl transferase subunit beta